MKEKLFYILFYLKCYPTYDLASILFDFDRAQAYRWVHRLQPIEDKRHWGRKKCFHYENVQKQYVNIHLPHKKPKKGKLTKLQKQENQKLSQERVLCENAFAGVKRYRAVSDIYRNRVAKFDDKLMLTSFCTLLV